MGKGVSLGRGEAGPREILLAVGRNLLGHDEAKVVGRTRGGLQPLHPPLKLSDGRGRSIVKGSYVSKCAEHGVPCIPASFVTYQGPLGLMQDCLRHRTKSQHC